MPAATSTAVTAATSTHGAASEESAAGHEHGGHEAAAVAPTPYDPTKPIDLGGVEGVTPEQQAAAENLIAITLSRLPQWSDPGRRGGRLPSIGDGLTGYEHLVQWDWITTTTSSTPSARSRSSTGSTATAPARWRRRCTCCRRARRSTPCPAGRRAHAVAHPRQPVLHAGEAPSAGLTAWGRGVLRDSPSSIPCP